ncbi:MAG: hypothetical protein JXA69_21490, partial [Phycisphaerae bacterium]|nr:hypothetical protein [Phycisphaerae bacterium]
TYLNGGGGLFVSGAEIGWDLDYSNNGQSFFRNTLGGAYIGDDGASYTAIGAGGILAGLAAFSFAPANEAPYDVEYPDRIGPQPGATTILNYFGGTGDSAGIQYDTGTYRVVMLGLPFETITSASTRANLMAQAMEFLLPDTTVPADFDGDGDVDLTDFGVFSACFNGPNRPPVYPESCTVADLDDDSDVDLTDFGMFAACFNGPNRPPACAE